MFLLLRSAHDIPLCLLGKVKVKAVKKAGVCQHIDLSFGVCAAKVSLYFFPTNFLKDLFGFIGFSDCFLGTADCFLEMADLAVFSDFPWFNLSKLQSFLLKRLLLRGVSTTFAAKLCKMAIFAQVSAKH